MQHLHRPLRPQCRAFGRHWGIWLAVTLGAWMAGEVAEPILPTPHLLVPLLAGLAVAGSGLFPDQVPLRLNRASQAALGVLMGSYLDQAALHQAAGSVLPLVMVIAATVALSLGAAAVLVRIGHMDRATATLGMGAGGSAAVVSCSKELGADARQVAFLQYLRVGLVAVTAPMLIHWMLASPASTADPAATSHGFSRLVTGTDQDDGLFLLVAVALVGAWLGRRIRLLSPVLLGPMLATAVLTTSGAATGFAPTGMLRSTLFTIVGLDVGLRFTRPAIARVGRLLPLAFACTIAVSAACAALAWLLSSLCGIPLSDAYLATTPGGINAVLVTGVATHANVPLISTVQSLRMCIMVLLAPLLIRVTRLRTTEAKHPRTSPG